MCPLLSSSEALVVAVAQIPVEGKYDISMWWPAAVPARQGWAKAMSVTIAAGDTDPTPTTSSATSVTVDLRTDGGDGWFAVSHDTQLGPNSTLTVECPSGGGDCIADAVLVQSKARWNDGSPATRVTLRSMDAIVLRGADGQQPAHCH